MAKKIRFSLEMEDGAEVRTLEELQEHFSFKNVLINIDNGKFDTWLRDRYLGDKADAIAELDRNDADFSKKLCGILDVEYDEGYEEEMEKAAKREEKRKKLREYTDGQEYFDNVDYVAFEPDDIYDLLDEGAEVIYLCGERFSVPLGKPGVTYIGVNRPTVVISSKEPVDWEEKDIILRDVAFDEKYQAIADAAEAKNSKSAKRAVSYGEYKESYIAFQLSPQDREAARHTYGLLSEAMEGLYYDPDRDVKDLRKSLLRAGIRGLAKNYLNNL